MKSIFNLKKFVAAILTFLFIMQQTMVLPVLAESNISGVTNGGSGSFDIHPQVANGDFGFRQYNDFNLGKGDVANLIFALKEGNITVDKFVNLVNNQIVINGILNAFKNGEIGGHAIFVSPNGMVVGASGVLNVGSLTAIAPTQQAYSKYIVDSAIGSALPEGYTHENNLAVLKASDMGSDITVNGKIIARGDVNLTAQTVNVGNTADNKAGILAGVDNAAITNAGQRVNEKLATTEAAGQLFNALVNNRVQNGTGFTKDANGNIVIQAQSIKTVVAPTLGDKLLIKGQEFVLSELSKPLVDEYGKVLDTEYLPDELKLWGITSENVQQALADYVSASIPSDATNPNAHNETNYAIVNIENAILKGNNVDISATSKADYIAQKNGTTLFDSAYSSAIGQIIEGSVTGEGFDFEGARAKAEVNIGNGADINADNDVNVNSLAVANTSIKTGTRYTPMIDSGQEYYYTLGSKTVSTINVNDGAEVTAGNDVKIHAQSQNSHNIKLKNPTSAIGQVVGGNTGIPTIQVLFLKSTLDAETSALINNGAIINAANVEVDAVNVSSDLSNINSIASIGKDNGGVAVAVTLKDTNINTTAKIDTTVNTNYDGNVSVNAQNLHMASNTSQATVDPKDPKLRMGDKFKFKILNLIAEKLSGVLDTGVLGTLGDLVPNVSTALVVNESNINTTAKIGANANIQADNVSVNANTVDLTVNTTKAHVKDGDSKASGSGSSGGVGDYIPNPGVAVIVNNQNNNTTAVIEDGTADQHANVTADNKLSVNATTELPRNNATFDLILNVIQAAGDIEDLPEDVKGNVNAELGKGDEWDIRLLFQGVTNPALELGSEISDIKFGIKNGGIKNNLGLQGFFNNWAETTSSAESGIGVAASVIVSDVVNNTVARIGDNAVVNAGDVVVNAANQVVQYNAAGDVAKLWKLTDGASGKKSGIGGNVVVESVESNARAQVGDGVVINATENAIGNTQNKTKGEVNIQAANQQDFLTAVVTGSKATGNNGVAISGSVTVQNVTGATEASLGASKVNASTLNIKAGEAQLATAQNSEGYLFHETVPKKDEDGNIVYDEYGDPVYEESNPFEDLNAEDYEVGLDPDLTSPQISNYMGVDSDTGLLVLNEASTIKDGISNILIAGAIASESAKASGTDGSGSTSSSGGAVGASVNVSQFDRDVKASIADGAIVNVTKDLNVLSDTYTQSIDVAIAGAFAGGVKLSKKEDKKDTDSSFAGNKLAESNPLFSKVSGLFDKVSGKLGSTEAPVGSDANPDVNVNGNNYKADADGVYKDANGNKLTASDGNKTNDVKFQGSTGKEAANLDNLSSKNGQSKNISVAAAGSVNVQLNESTVTSEVGNAQITVGKDVNVKAEQTTKSLNIGGGIAKAATVGAGAAVNFVENINETKASLKGTDITFKGSDNKLNVKAAENNDNVQVAIGVGVTKADQGDTTTQVSAGGSFNTDILENKVNAKIDGAKVRHESGADTIAVDVNAENHSASYKGAGGMSVNVGQSGNNSVGAGMGGNLNLITKETSAKIIDSEINNTKSVSVAANKDNTQKTEDLISVGVGGSVIASASNGYSFSGAMATDVINNTINAQIDNSTVNSTGDVDVVANNNFNNRNLAGALSFSSASEGVGVGAGAIVSVINNSVNASIANNSKITAKNVNVNADNNENLQFLAANMGIQTGAGIPISANGIVNVIQNDISASVSDSDITNSVTLDIISDSDITNSGTLDIISDYDTSIEGITVGVAATSEGKFSVGANVLSNTLLSSNTAQLINSDTTSTDKLTVKATTDGNIDAIPAAAAITASGSAAAAANVGVNVVQNSTTAKIDGTNNKKSTVSADGIEVSASDNTKSRSRGGIIAAAGGTAAVGGSILADVYLKDVDAHIDNTTVTKGGNIKVDASAKNIFGEETPGSVTASALVDKITGDYDMSNDTDYQNWDMTFDVAGASTAGVSGSLISKNVINDVDSYIGSNVVIQEAGNIDVLASNKTVADVIVGSITAGGTAAVGGSIFSNVNVSTVDAGIKNGAQIGSDTSRVGNVNIKANSEQTYKSIMAIVGAAGTAAVKGSINSNVIVNSTNAYVGNGVNMYSDSLNVAAADSMDSETLNVAVSAAGSAAVGGAIFTNVLANKVNSIVGKNGTDGQKAGNINTTGEVKVSANDDQNFQGNVLVTSAAGAAGVGAVAIANVMASEVNAGIENTTVTSNNGSVTVSANNSFNGDHKDQNTGLQSLIDNGSVSSDDISNLIPLVGVITIGAAGSAGVSATLIANVVTTTVNAYVDNSTISTANSLNVDADSSMTTYDAALSVAAAGVAGVGVNGVTNIYSGTTIASVTDSTVNGSLNVTADDLFNLNTIIFTTAVSGTAAVTAITNVNTISNEVTAKVEDSNIKNAQTVDVDAHNTVKTTDVLAAGAVAGTGAGVNVAPIVNVFTNDTNAYIKGGSINNAATTVAAGSDIDVISAILGVSGSGIGASVSGFAGINVFDNDLNAYILGTKITNAKSTSVASTAELDLDGIIGAVAINGVGASVLVNGIVNVIKNNVNAYIADSSISGGSVSVSAVQNSDIDNTTASIGINGVGAAVSANALVSVLTNNLNANITNTSVDAASVSVSANNKQDILNNNIGVGGSGTASGGVNTTINVLENTARAYIDAQDKTINTSGKVSVAAKDEILMQTNLGLVSGSGFGSAGANVNINIINNAVLSQLLSSEKGQINAGSVEVKSDSIIGLDEGAVTAAAAGFGGVAGTVFVNSIGGKVSDYSSDSNLKDAGIDDSITQANTNFDTVVNGITYEKDGQTQSLAGSYNLTEGAVKGGTQADINANVNTTGAEGVKVSANNTLKGYNSDTMNITNATAAGGLGAAGVGVLVTDMKYNTTASISGGNVDAQDGKVSVEANSNIKANTNAIGATIGAVSIAGGVAYFNNSADTTAKIENAVINTSGDVNVIAESEDDIFSKALAGSFSGAVSANINIALAETNNKVNALISGSDVDITANNLNVKAADTSTLESELQAASVGYVSAEVVVNRAVSNAEAKALISLDNDSNVDINDALNIISQTGGINTINNVNVGSLGFYNVGGNYQLADSNASFTSGIEGGNITAKNVKINAGTAVDSDKAGLIKSTVNTKKATGGFVDAAVTVIDANANGSANAKVTGGTVTADDDITINSKLDRTANIESEDFSGGGISINALVVSTSTGGDTNINTNGSTLTADNINMLASSTNTTSASMVSGEVSLIGGDGTVVEAVSGGNAKIDAGNINADNTNLKVDIKRNATITKNEKAVSLVGLKVTDLKAKTTGTSGINTYGTIQNKTEDGQAQKVVINTVDNSVAQNESAETSIGFIEGSVLNIETTSDSAITNNIAGSIKAQDLDIISALNRTAISNAASKEAGLVGIGVMNLTSQIGNANTTTISAAIEAGSVDVDSTMTSTVESYVHDFSAGLVALAYGATKNIVQDTAKNIVNFNGSINADSLDAYINTLSNAYLFKESGNYGLFVVKGGELSNTLKATSELNLKNAKINTKGDALFTVVNNAHTPSEMQVTDDAGGFVVKDGAQLKNDLAIGASINVNGDTNVLAGDHLDLDITSGTTGFKQKVTSSGSGFAAYNSASSVVGATINNAININGGVLSAKHVDINMNSSNDLSSIASVDTHHFAGDPSVNSEVNLTINNNLNVAGELFAMSSDTSVQDTNVNINFMGYSSQTLKQDSWLYIEAAVATGSADGGINFVTNNNVNVEDSGVISSQKDINIIFDKGTESLESRVAYDKVSRLLFGIKIHDRGEYSSVRNTSNNNAQIDGKLIAGKNNSMHMTIDKKGNATGTINDSLYEKQDKNTSVDAGKDSQAAKDEIAKIDETLDDLDAEKEKLETTNETNTTNYENLLEQIEALKLQLAMAEYIQNVTADGKISETAFKAEIVQMLTDNGVENAANIANQILDYYTSSSEMPIYSFTTPDGATVVLKYAVDEDGNYIKENGNYKFADINGYNISYENGKPVSVTPEGSESVINVGALDFNGYLSSLGIEGKTLTDIKTSLAGMDISQTTQIITTEDSGSKEVTFLTTGGKIIYDSTYVDNIQAVQTEIDTANTEANNLNSVITSIADDIADINKQIEENTARKENIAANGLTGLEAKNGSYIFKDLNATSGTINIQANKGKSNVDGSGEVIMSLADVMINNYSNYNLIFNDVTVGGGLGSFVVDGKTVSENPYNGITISTTGTAGNEGGITINNWYDQNDPVNNTAIGVLPSNIIFNGTINTGVGNVNLYNESGDIEINDGIVANTLKVNVAQGSFTQDTKGQEYVLKAGDTLFAGKNINITASKITVEGNMQAGIADKNITITQDMLDNAVEETQKVIVTDADGTTPLKDDDGNIIYEERKTGRLLVKLASGRDDSEGIKQSDYMYDKNNIKAIYDPDTNTVELFGVKVTDEANINLTATSSDADAVYVSDKSSIKYANGYGEINIDNQTNAHLVVNGLENNKISGAVTYNDSTELPEYGSKIIEETKFGIHQIDKFPYIAIGEYTVETEKTVGFGANPQNTADATLTDGKTTVDTSKNNTTGDLIVNGLISSGNLKADKAGLLLQTNGNLVINNRVASQGSDQVPTIDTKGDVVLNKLTDKGGVIIQGLIKNSGSVSVTNNGTEGITVAAKGFIDNTTGNVGLTNNNGVINIAGKINNEGADVVITNDSANGGIITVAGSEIKNNGADINLINNGTKGIETSGNILAAKGDINVTNKKGNINFKESSSIKLNEGYTTQTNKINILNSETAASMTIAGAVNNYGTGDIDIQNKGTGAATIAQTAVVSNNIGNMLVTNENSSLTIAGTVSNTSGQTDVTNSGDGGVKVSGTVKNTGGALNVVNNNKKASAIITTADSLIQNSNGVLNVTNEGAQGISHAGTIHNIKGVTNIVNNNTSDTSAIKIATTANVTNNDGTITIKNFGTKKDVGLDIEGIVNAIKQNIEITNENSNIEIGEYDSNNDFYVNAQNGNIIISQKNGDILNGVVDPDTQNKNQNHDLGNKDKAYKTLLTTGGNLSMNLENGNIGADSHALNGKESGFGVNASTRDYTESINVKVNGTVNAKATNNGNALVNIRAKDSDLKVNNITSDGNVMLTAVDWKQADARPTPSDDSYYHGYSIVNAASDKSKANVEGRNISLISSDNLGTKGNAFTYNQLENGSISAMAENDLYIKGMGQNDNLWQLITKRGNMGLEFTGNAIIRELTAGKHLEIVSQGANLTIYDLGKSTNLADTDDILYPHDNILMSSVAPETVDIRVLDTNPDTRVNPNDANSTLNIYNAYIKGQSNGSADVTLRADNIIAHAYDAASSPVSNVARPDGFDATEGRLYANDYMNPDADKNLKATGFNTVGSGSKLVFDIQGVSPEDVINAGAQVSDRNYKPQGVTQTIEIFDNPIGFDETVYKSKDVTLSLNSGANAPSDNRGMEISKIYTDNAYVDTKDLNMHISDAFITNYGEFRNGNLGGQGGGHFISDDYRWLTIVDNDYYRNITNNFGIPVTSQLYTKLTGSFALNMGNVIALETKAPVVHYNPYEVILLPRTENSFYRLTYKDDKIQKTTTTPDFADIDKSTYKPTKRDSIRFAVKQGDGYVNISNKKKKKEENKRIISIENISRGGLAVVHDGSLKKGERFVIDLDYHNIKASPEVEVVRVSNDRAGLKFINMDNATANKILYMNMFTAEAEDQSPQMSKK